MWTVYIFISNSYTLGFALSYCFSRTLFRKRIKCLFSEHFLASKSCLFPRCITRIVISNLGMSIGIFFRSMLLFTATSPELHPPITLHGAKQSFIDRCPSASWASIHSWKSVCGREPPSITNKKKSGKSNNWEAEERFFPNSKKYGTEISHHRIDCMLLANKGEAEQNGIERCIWSTIAMLSWACVVCGSELID